MPRIRIQLQQLRKERTIRESIQTEVQQPNSEKTHLRRGRSH